MIPVFPSENAINMREEKKIPEGPQDISSLMSSTVHMLFRPLVFRGGGTGQERSAQGVLRRQGDFFV